MQVFLRIAGSFRGPYCGDHDKPDYGTDEYRHVCGIPAIVLCDVTETEAGHDGAEVSEDTQDTVGRGRCPVGGVLCCADAQKCLRAIDTG